MAPRTKTESLCKHPLPPQRKHVLLLTCMDQRLLDDTVTFMNGFNLANRYDQLVFAGAALGVLRLSSPRLENGDEQPQSIWKDVFFHHLKVTIDVLGREIKDIFIVEHRDCGAYKHFHPEHHEYYNDDKQGQDLEEAHHRDQAFLLAAAIRSYCAEQQKQAPERAERWKLKVHCFLMDLRGDVKHLCEECHGSPKRSKRTAAAKKRSKLTAAAKTRRPQRRS